MITFTIYGQPQSKANSRNFVIIKDRPALVKSKKAQIFEKDARRQIPWSAKQMLQGELCVTLHIYYATERSDLDESIILDVLQPLYRKIKGQRQLLDKGVYINDRQVREKHVYHYIDKRTPRVEIMIEHRGQRDLLS